MGPVRRLSALTDLRFPFREPRFKVRPVRLEPASRWPADVAHRKRAPTCHSGPHSSQSYSHDDPNSLLRPGLVERAKGLEPSTFSLGS